MGIKQVVISGYYGFNNSGDEAVLKSILTALQQVSDQIEPVVLSAQPEQTSQDYGVQAVSRTDFRAIRGVIRQSHGLISGGGSLLQDVTGLGSIPYYLAIIKMAQWIGKPTFIYAQGVGPVQRKWFYPLIKHTFQRTLYLSVRDGESAQLLRHIGIRTDHVNVVPDPVIAMEPESRERVVEIFSWHNIPVEQKPIAFAIRSWGDNSAVLDEWARLADRLAEDGEQVVFLPFHHPSDVETSKEIIFRMKQKAYLLQKELQPAEMLGVVGRCRLLVGMRLHSLIYAANQYVPTVGVSYDPKIDQFLKLLDERPACTVEEMNADVVYDLIRQRLSAGEGWLERAKPKVDTLKQRAIEPAQNIANLLDVR